MLKQRSHWLREEPVVYSALLPDGEPLLEEWIERSQAWSFDPPLPCGQANSLEGDGVLTTNPPKADRLDTYIYDPERPTKSTYGTHGHIPGAVDAQPAARGNEVLVYQTPPLADTPRFAAML